jgi:DNA-binding beta-propeller fold protein YncE
MGHRFIIIVGLLLLGCGGTEIPSEAQAKARWLNLAPVPNPNDSADPQPRRHNPYAVTITPDGSMGLVTLRGSELQPSNEVVLIDMRSRREASRIDVGDRPHAVVMHPGGNHALVLSQLSRFASVIDIVRRTVVSTIDVGYYAHDLVFSQDGSFMYVINRASDDLTEWRVSSSGLGLTAERRTSVPAGSNPEAIGSSAAGDKLYVADAGNLGVRVYDRQSMEELAFILFDAPVFDIEPMGQWMVATTLNDTRGLPCEDDGDYVGTQGDGIYPMVTDRTCSRGFADIQNEIAFIDTANDTIAVRYTSDSAEVSEADREGDHDPSLMRVVGALPQVVHVVDETTAYVSMGASDELVELTIDTSTPPQMIMPRSFPTGFAPRGVAVDAFGKVALVADKLGETVTVISLDNGNSKQIGIGNTSPSFPATSAEIGELFAHSAKFATDGDQSCVHCHPDNHTDGKTWGVGIVRAFGRRATLPMRNLHDTKPLLVEGVFDETDFSLEMEGISFRPDFHDSSYTLQVERRDLFYRETSLAMFGLEVSFNAMVSHVGAFLMVEPRLLPSPFDHGSEQAERGKALFERPDIGCAACHPGPTFASESLFEGITTLGKYDLPRRDLDPDVSIKFIEQAKDGFFNANSLRGLWDRPGVLFHDGRARSIRESVLTPGHPCLLETERAFNEFEGQVDTNGGVSHLSCEQIDDLIAYLVTIN